MKIISYCLMILVLAALMVVAGKAQGFGKVTQTYRSVDGCNTVTCFEGGGCMSTAMYCGKFDISSKAPGDIIGGWGDHWVHSYPDSPVPTVPTDPNPSAFIQQPNYIGFTFHTSIEQASSGNGAIVGFALWNNHQITKVPGLSLASSLSITWDTKKYLGKSGIAPRLHSSLRYHLPIASDNHRTFVQSGFRLSSVQYSGSGGYAKFGFQPTVGAGVDLSPDDQSASLLVYFNYGFRSPLYGQQSLTNSANRIKDGWTSGPMFGLESIWPLGTLTQGRLDKDNKWGLILHTEIARPTYQRNAQYYGPVLGAELHRFVAVDISIGLARFY